jgi:hydroxymethylbilane synthase
VTPLRIGTRGSTLALAQAHWVKAQIAARHRDAEVELVVIKTSGDRFVDAALQTIGGKGVFTKEIEEALLRNELDLAVHSMKDLPTELAPGLCIAAVPRREDPRDVLVSRDNLPLERLSAGARIGTGSLRRRAQLLRFRPDLTMVAIRGNIDTRLKKLDGGEVDALVMAAAGLKRIGRQQRITEFIAEHICVSAVAQGALALESRSDGVRRDEIAFLHDAVTFAEVTAERSLLRRLGGGCHVPVGARASVAGDQLRMTAVVADPNADSLYRREISGPAASAEQLGRDLAERLLRDGADKILAKHSTENDHV